MSAFSRDFWRSNLSFLASFTIHAILIVVLAVCFMSIRGKQIISLSSETSEIGETVSFDFQNLQADQSLADAIDRLNEPVLAELEPVELIEDTWSPETDADYQVLAAQSSGMKEYSEADLQDWADSMLGTRSVGFFGIEASGNRIVYILDISASMSYASYFGRRYDRAVGELINSVSQLREDQSFYVYLFCFECFEMELGQPNGEFVAATRENIDLLSDWLNGVQLGSGTDPRLAIVKALEREPTCVFLLSDGEFNGEYYDNPPYHKRISAATLAKRHNTAKCPIHTIGLEDKGSQRQMMNIAEQSGGEYRFVSGRQ